MKKTQLISAISASLILGSSLALAAPYIVVDVADGATISGKVSFNGDDPAPKIFAITKDPDVCGTGNREVDFVNTLRKSNKVKPLMIARQQAP
jgi:hypothetical protein